MSRRLKVVLALGAVLAVALGAGTWWFLRDDAPPEVSLAAAAGSVDDAGEALDAIDGTWRVDTETGDWDYDRATARSWASASRRSSPGSQSALDTSTFPTATFELTEELELGETPAQGVDVAATGDLTIHGVTKRVSIPLEAKVVGRTIVVVGALDRTFSDFGVEVPSAPIVLSADDHGVLELQVLLVRG